MHRAEGGPPAAGPDRRTGSTLALQVCVLVLASLAVWVPRASGPIDLRWDAAAYYTLGTALAERGDYRYLNEPGDIRTTQYPPGVPAIVAVHQLVMGTSDPVAVGRALRLTYFLLFTANILAAFAFLRRHLPSWTAVALALVATMTFAAIWVSDRAYTDLPFALAVNLFLLAVAGGGRWSGMGAGVCAAAAFMLRTTGLALLGAWVLDAMLRRKVRAVFVRGVVSAACVLAWAGYIRAVEHSDEYRNPAYPYQRALYNMYNVAYTKNFSLRDPNDPGRGRLTARDWAARLLERAGQVPEGLAATVGNSRTDWELAVGGAKTQPGFRYIPWRSIPLVLYGSAGLVVAGFVLLALRGQLVMIALGALYLAQMCLLPTVFFWPRYLSSLGALTALALGTALVAIARTTVLRRWRTAVLTAPLLLILAAQALALVWFFRAGHVPVTHPDWAGHRVDYRLFSYDEAFRAFDGGIDWLQARAAPGDLVVSSMPHWVHLRTGLKAIMPPFERERARALDLLEAAGARYVIVEASGFSFTREYARPALRAAEGRWRLVHRETPGLEIWCRESTPDTNSRPLAP